MLVELLGDGVEVGLVKCPEVEASGHAFACPAP